LKLDIEKNIELLFLHLGICLTTMMQGGLGSGDFGLIFGNPGGGKSWTLIALGGHAVELGYNVVHYTLELGEDYVGRRYDAFFTGIPVNEILKHKSKVESLLLITR
jgi:KaiC/GvpD/RAD55 family RecA-like ATPase